MIKLLKEHGDFQPGEVIGKSKRGELNLVKAGIAEYWPKKNEDTDHKDISTDPGKEEE